MIAKILLLAAFFQFTVPFHTGAIAASGGGGGAISFVDVSAGSLSAVPTPVTTSTTLNIVAGDKLIVFCKTGGSNNTLTVTDTAGDTFGKGTHQNDGSIGNTDLFYSVAATSNSSEYFTCNSSNSANFSGIIALQYRGGATSSVNDAATNGASAGGAWTTSSFSTVQAEVVVQCMATSVASSAGTIGGVAATMRYNLNKYACQDVIFTSAQTSIVGIMSIPGTGVYNGQLGSFK